MKIKTKEIFEVNDDIITLLSVSQEIGWKELRESSIHRIIYLSSVLYNFMNKPQRDFYRNYLFSLSSTGPYSKTIKSSIIDLKRREYIKESSSGVIELILPISHNQKNSNKKEWFRIVVYILGLYGESKIFGFVINDPQYRDFFQRNSIRTIDISDQNSTVMALRSFQEKFEKTLNDTSNIQDKEYLELYFEFVFSKIIKKKF